MDFTKLLPLVEGLGFSAVIFLLLIGLRSWILGLLNKKSGFPIAKELLRKTHVFFLLFFSLFLGSLWFEIDENLAWYAGKASFIAFMILAGLWGSVAVDTGFEYLSNRYREKEGISSAVFSMARTISKIVLAGILFLFILDNLNFEVSTLIAGIGIGGIAVALAVQNILQDLFASLSIVVDKPFLIGDFLIVDSYMGKVEYIGIKTTRLRSLSGEQLIFSNGDLLKSRLRNYKKMKERRIVFKVEVVYETPIEKIKKIPELLREAVTSASNSRFERAHFKDYGAYSLDFETVYFVNSPDYNVYMDSQQEINLAIFQKFSDEGIEFAYPTAKSIRIEPDK